MRVIRSVLSTRSIARNRGLGKDRHTRARRDEVGDQTHTFDFDRNTQLDAFGAGRGLDLLAQRVAERRENQRLARDPLQRDGLAAEVARRRHERDQLLVAQVLDVQTRVEHRFGDDRAGQLAFGDLGRESLGRAFGESQRHARRGAANLGDDRGHERPADGADDAKGRVPGLQALDHRDVLVQRVELAADRTCAVQHTSAELGRCGAAAAAYEQLDAELLLELADVLGDVRLDRVEAVGGRGEAALLGDCEQRLELAKVHVISFGGSPPGAPAARLPTSHRFLRLIVSVSPL